MGCSISLNSIIVRQFQQGFCTFVCAEWMFNNSILGVEWMFNNNLWSTINSLTTFRKSGSAGNYQKLEKRRIAVFESPGSLELGNYFQELWGARDVDLHCFSKTMEFFTKTSDF